MSGLQEIINTKVAVGLGSSAVLATSGTVAAINADIIPVIAGIAVGIVGLGWSIINAGLDRRIQVHEAQEQLLQRLLEQSEKALDACRDGKTKLREDNEKLTGRVARLEEDCRDLSVDNQQLRERLAKAAGSA